MISATGVSGGPFEANGNLANDFDILHEDLWMGMDSYEKAQRVLLEEAVRTTLAKAKLEKEQIEFLFAGDLINQITPTSFAARTMQIPYFGLLVHARLLWKVWHWHPLLSITKGQETC